MAFENLAKTTAADQGNHRKTVKNGAPGSSTPNRAAALRLSAVLLIGGSLHFIAPKFFDGIIPPALPGNPRRYTQASGIAAIGIGTGLAIPRSRRTSALFAAIFFIAVMPAKVQMTVDWLRSPTKSRIAKIGGIIQLFGQIPLVTEALEARGRSR